MKVKRYRVEFDTISYTLYGVECPNGEYVEYKDYEHLSDYCDRLVEIGKLPCLPKDLENLRDANAKLAQQNHELQCEVLDLRAEIEGWKNKWEAAVTMAAKAGNERDNLRLQLHKAVELRDIWHGKWQTAKNECIKKVDAVKEVLDNFTYKA